MDRAVCGAAWFVSRRKGRRRRGPRRIPMRSLPFVSTMLLAVAFVGGPGVGPVSAQTEAQAVQQQIEQLRQDFDALKQQYGERLTALEARLGGDSRRAGRP